MNGFSEKEFSHPEKIESIELVLEEFYKMSCVYIFTNLKQLTLINVGLTAIEVEAWRVMSVVGTGEFKKAGGIVPE